MMPAGSPESTFEIVIDKLAGEGRGLGRRSDGKVVLVDGALPGERVRVAIDRERRDYVVGRTIAVLQAAADRVTPSCPHAERCGGCDFCHVDSSRQVAYKEAVLHEQLARGGGVTPAEVTAAAEPPVAAPAGWGYRARLRLHGDAATLGLYGRGSRTLVEVDSCPVATPAVNRAMAALRAATARHPLVAGEYELIDCDDEVLLVVSGRRHLSADYLAALSTVTGIRAVTVRGARRWYRKGMVVGTGPPSYRYVVDCPSLGRQFVMQQWAGGFSQVNRTVNGLMLDRIGDWLRDLAPTSILDCYCGNGNISVVAGALAGRVVGVESDVRSVEQARYNTRRAGFDHCRFVAGRVEREAGSLAARGERFECAIVDPPRAGCRDLVDHFAALGCRAILLVSCQPATLARDIGLLRRFGYRLERLCAVDMFPQTHHLETLALLRR